MNYIYLGNVNFPSFDQNICMFLKTGVPVFNELEFFLWFSKLIYCTCKCVLLYAKSFHLVYQVGKTKYLFCYMNSIVRIGLCKNRLVHLSILTQYYVLYIFSYNTSNKYFTVVLLTKIGKPIFDFNVHFLNNA